MAFAVVAVAIVVLVALWPSIESAFAPPGPAPVWENVTLTSGPRVGYHPANPFYAVVFTAANRTTPSLLALGNYLNSTPITWFRYGGGGEGYDPTTQTDYLPPNGGGRFVATPLALWNLTWFKSWCLSRTPHCDWLGYLPAELNLTQAAVHTAEWFHSVLGFAPELWQLGNEPESWAHFGENYTVWSTLDHSSPTPAAYATMEANYIGAVSALYPSDRFVGVEASCANCDTTLISASAQVGGPSLGGMAYHTYPTLPGGSSSLGQFYGALSGSVNLSSTVAQFSSSISSACPACASVPVELGEYQAGPHGAPSPYASGVPGALFLAASIVQALRLNVSMFTVFDSGSLLNPSTNLPSPEGLLYQRVLENMTMGNDYADSLGGSTVPAFSVLIENGSRESLLLVNPNVSTGFNLTIPASAFPVGSLGTARTWSNGGAFPTVTAYAALPSDFELPPQSLLLLNNYE